MTDIARIRDEELQARFAELERQHRTTLVRRSTAELGSEEYVAIQKTLAQLEVEMNLISGVLAERAGRGYVAIPGRE